MLKKERTREELEILLRDQHDVIEQMAVQAGMKDAALLAEVVRLRDLVEFAIAAIDSNHCYMGEEAQVDLRDYLKEMMIE